MYRQNVLQYFDELLFFASLEFLHPKSVHVSDLVERNLATYDLRLPHTRFRTNGSTGRNSKQERTACAGMDTI
jgi:hypothetical protein